MNKSVETAAFSGVEIVVLIKPFLKWAGSKTKLISKIKAFSENRDIFIEPFVGSGAVFLNMNGYNHYYLYDINPDLINIFKTLQVEGKEFIDYCELFFNDMNNKEDEYYKLRKRFNVIRKSQNRESAALFLYLNRHCFNGLCRYNLKGEFNVPYGKYKKPYFPRIEMEYFHLKSQNAEFINADFREAFKESEKYDSCFIYCDPPYVNDIDNKNEGFTSYSKDGFTNKDQIDLAECANETKHLCLISNHSTSFTKDIYSKANIIEFEVKRFIAANKDNRRNASELLAVFNSEKKFEEQSLF